MISDERLEELGDDNTICKVSWDERVEMARELLALRKAFSETAVYEAEINGVMSSVTKSHYEDCKKYGVKTRELIVKPTPPQ
ncbi:hypothetical protein [Pantoea sp. MT58]|uniref:hypothetical protein n=1 Tax=Pantoea sp. MT58 TaxID=2768165 RepID=UPI00165A97CA|nr:hypothetical protein [Pantoea sp. MT58]QNQ59741.1 hypothetical protein IAI47_05710 [Pantoea sp. MT58]